jgi:HPt (histidine-containing phosphotransfer) domain-containing protein
MNLPSDDIRDSLLDVYASELKSVTEAIGHAYDAGDLAKVADLCHKARGAASTYGFGDLAQRFGTLEGAARHNADGTELALLMKVVHRVASGVLASIQPVS